VGNGVAFLVGIWLVLWALLKFAPGFAFAFRSRLGLRSRFVCVCVLFALGFAFACCLRLFALGFAFAFCLHLRFVRAWVCVLFASAFAFGFLVAFCVCVCCRSVTVVGVAEHLCSPFSVGMVE